MSKYTYTDGPFDNLFIDTELSTGANDGTSWADAYRSFSDFHTANNDATNKDVYVKVPSAPARLDDIAYAGMAGKNFYFNASGVGTALQTQRGIYFGSDQLDISSATLVSGTTYKVSYTANATFIANCNAPSKYGVWVCSGGSMSNEFYYSTIQALKGASPYGGGTVGTGRHYYDSGAEELYFNIGRAPVAGEYIEAVRNNRVVEIYDFNTLHGGIFRFGNQGQSNGTCSGSPVFYCDFSWNALYGFNTSADPDDATGGPTVVEACTMNYNGTGGLNIDGNGESVTARFCTMIGNIIYGYRNRGINSGDGNYLHNCVITGSTYGVYTGNGTEVQNTVMYNNIIWGNTTDIFVTDNANNTITYDYNAAETFGGKGAQQANDVTVDPSIATDGSIDSDSSAWGVGKDDVYSTNVYDLTLEQVTDNSGTPLFNMNMGAFAQVQDVDIGSDYYAAVGYSTVTAGTRRERLTPPKRGGLR